MSSKPMSDGGKGSVRRNEDNDAYRNNFDAIFGKKKGKTMMNEDPQERSDEDYERSEDDGYEICHRCNGSGEGMYDGSRCGFCKGTGEEPVERDCDDFDFPEDDYDYN